LARTKMNNLNDGSQNNVRPFSGRWSVPKAVRQPGLTVAEVERAGRTSFFMLLNVGYGVGPNTKRRSRMSKSRSLSKLKFQGTFCG